MADHVKTKKAASLSAARKKLKEYQQNQATKKPVKNASNDNKELVVQPQNSDNVSQTNKSETPVDSMASSTHSSINPEFQLQENTYIQNTNSAQNFFNTALFQGGETNHLLSNYFDTLPKNANDSIIQSSYSERSSEQDSQAVNSTYADPFDFTSEQQNLSNTNVGSSNIDYGRTTSESPNIQENFNITNIDNEQDSSSVVSQNTIYVESALVENANIDVPVEIQKTTYSNTESLRQLSSQLTSLIDSEETIPSVNANSELERRNQELASLLEKEQQKNEQLNLQLREYNTRINQLETETQQMKNEHEAKLSREIGPLQEEIQCYVQSVGVLVGERTELELSLNQSQATVKQKTAECEELQGRLRASRHRVSELEKEVNTMKAIKDNIDKNEREASREIERFKLEYGMLKDQFEEISEEAIELREKLNIKSNETLSLQQEIQEKNSLYSLAQLRIQQLTVGDNLQTESHLETLNQQKISLEQQVAELTQTVKLVSAERDQASQQYQQYVQQLNTQLQKLAAQLQEKNKESETLSQREQSLVKHISELEKHLQQLQTEKQNLNHQPTEIPPVVRELEEKIKILESEKSDIGGKYKTESNKKENLEKELLEKNLKIEELNFKIEQMALEQPDANKLVAAMESDKIAAARATEQNQILKDQLAELQDGFVKMSNNKLELTEKLESEQHHCRELSDKLTYKETEVHNLHLAISAKDTELMELENTRTELNKQILQQNQLLDRLRHYEAQGNVMELLQQELKESNQNLEKVTLENIELTKMIAELQNKECNSESATEMKQNEESSTEVEDPIKEGIRKKIEELENKNSELELQMKEMYKNEENYGSKSEQYLDKENAMIQLEERFTKTMVEVADLTEEKQRLEHLVLQLQSETETIGEYVTLYQCQRAMLKQKTLEKDEQLERLNRDREEMKVKLEELNNLIKNFMLEKGDIPEELLNNKLLKNYRNYCEIHKENIDAPKTAENEKALSGSNNENNNLGTAGQIIALLSEIKTSNLVQPGSENSQNFHPCPCCSGKLITV